MTIHMEKTFQVMHCQKCGKYFKKKWESWNTWEKNTWFFFFGSWLEISIFQTSFKKYKSQTNGQFSKYSLLILYFPKSMGPLPGFSLNPSLSDNSDQTTLYIKLNLQCVWFFLPPPNFPLCQNPEKNRVPNWPPPKNGRVQDLAPLNSPELGTLLFFGGGQFGTLFFFWILAHKQIWGWQEESDTL